MDGDREEPSFHGMVRNLVEGVGEVCDEEFDLLVLVSKQVQSIERHVESSG